jgi:hypothetical protein
VSDVCTLVEAAPRTMYCVQAGTAGFRKLELAD